MTLFFVGGIGANISVAGQMGVCPCCEHRPPPKRRDKPPCRQRCLRLPILALGKGLTSSRCRRPRAPRAAHRSLLQFLWGSVLWLCVCFARNLGHRSKSSLDRSSKESRGATLRLLLSGFVCMCVSRGMPARWPLPLSLGTHWSVVSAVKSATEVRTSRGRPVRA